MYETYSKEQEREIEVKEIKKQEDHKNRSYFGFLKDIVNPLINLMKEPTSRWVTIASMMRTLAGIAVATFLPIYFLKVFPDYKN